MGKGLDQYPEEEREKIALRRVKEKTKGISYWGAVDYLVNRGSGNIKDPLQAEQLVGIATGSHKSKAKGKKKHHANNRRPAEPTLAAALDAGSKRRLEALRAG